MSIIFAPVQLILGVVPVVTWPAWFAVSGSGSVVAMAADWGQHVGSIGGWFPVAAFFDAAGIVIVCQAAGLIIKATKTLVSMITGGGGAS